MKDEGGGREEGADTELKTKTTHVNVGKKRSVLHLSVSQNVVWIDNKGVRNTERKIVPEQTAKLITDAKKYGQALIDTCC